jgi:hypothetical protein
MTLYVQVEGNVLLDLAFSSATRARLCTRLWGKSDGIAFQDHAC